MAPPLRRLAAICTLAATLAPPLAGGEAPVVVTPLPFAPYYESFTQDYDCVKKLEDHGPSPDLDDQLLALLQASAVHNTVLFMVFLPGSSDHVENFDIRNALEPRTWIDRMVCSGARPVVLVSSKKWYRAFAEIGALPYYSPAFIRQMEDITGGDGRDVNLIRWTLAESILRAGYHAMYVDMDVLWFGDVRESYKDEVGFDAYFQSQCHDEKFEFDAPQIKHWLREAKRHNENVCCSAVLSHICTGVMLLRATPGTIDLAARVRARHLAGPCENMQSSIMEIHEMCAPKGPLRCGLFSERGVQGFGRFEDFVRKARAGSGSASCGGKKGSCSEAMLGLSGPLLVHLDSAGDDKRTATKMLNGMLPPPTCRVDYDGKNVVASKVSAKTVSAEL